MDQELKKIQKKFQDSFNPGAGGSNASLQQTSNMMQKMGMGGLSKDAMDAWKKSTASVRAEMDQLMKSQKNGLEDAVKRYSQSREELDKMVRKVKEFKGASEDLQKIENQVLELRKKNNEELAEAVSLQETLSKTAQARQQVGANGGGGGFGGIGQTFQQYQQGGGGIGGITNVMGGSSALMAAGIAAAVGTAIIGAMRVGTEIHNDLGTAEFKGRRGAASAISGSMGTAIGDMQSAYGQSNLANMKFAQQQTGKEVGVKRSEDQFTTGAQSIANNKYVQALASAVPGLGTSLQLGSYGISALTGDETNKPLARQKLLEGVGNNLPSWLGGDWMKKKAAEQGELYKSNMGQYSTDLLQKNIQAEKQSNPLQDFTRKWYSENMDRNLGAQRSMGLDDEGLYGAQGFLRGANNAGFTQEQGLGMSDQILGAGGSSSMARNATSALQLQRGMNLTNAGSVLGKLSGNMGESEVASAAAKKILMEATRDGYDSTKHAAEMRKFAEVTATMVQQYGANSEAGAGNIAKTLGSFTAGNTMASIQGSQSAYQRYQDMTSQTTGSGGAMQAGGLLQSKLLSKVPIEAKQRLMQLPEARINEDDPFIISMAQGYGIDPKALVSEIKGIKSNSTNRYVKQDQAMDVIKKNKVDMTKLNDPAYLRTLSPEVSRAATTARSLSGIQFGQTGVAEENAILAGNVNGFGANTPEATGTIATDSGKMGDKTTKNLAESQKLVLDGFDKFKDAINPAAEDIKAFNAAIIKATDAISALSGDKKAQTAAINQLNMNVPWLSPAPTQTNTTAPGSGGQ